MVKLLYLLLGLSLKETLDSGHKLLDGWRERLEKQRASWEKPPPGVPALLKGSPEAASAIARAVREGDHRKQAGPVLAKINKKLRIIAWVPFACWGTLTFVLLGVVSWIEYHNPTP